MEQRLRLIQRSGTRTEKRAAERSKVKVPGQIVWKDAKGRLQMASVMTVDVSEQGVRIESRGKLALPLYRLVQFQIDRSARNRPDVPPSLRRPNLLSAVFRIGQCDENTGVPADYGLRLLIDPAATRTDAKPWPTAATGTRSA